MSGLFMGILEMSIWGSVTACIVMLIRLPLRMAPRIFSYALWGIVLFRLICPFTFESPIGILPTSSVITTQIGLSAGESQDTPSGGTISAWMNQFGAVPTASIPAAGPAAGAGSITGDRVTDEGIINEPENAGKNEINSIGGIIGSDGSIDISGINGADIAALIWAAGVIFLTFRTLFGYLRLRRRLNTATRIAKYKNVYETDRILTPFVLGFLRPRIYLPAGITGTLYILRHEQTHIRRRDHLIKPISYAVLCLHWFNPLLWISYYLMCGDMEMSCDESVLRHSDKDIRKAYSGSLLALGIRQNKLSGSLMFGGNRTGKRVRNAMKYRKPTLGICGAAILIVLGVSVILAGSRTPASEVSPNPSVTPISVSWEKVLPEEDTNNDTDYFSTLPASLYTAVSREGMLDVVHVGLAESPAGYAIYLFDGFEMVSSDTGDLIRPAADYPYLWPIQMNITNVDIESHTFDAEMDYPPDAEGEPEGLLYDMKSMIIWPDGLTAAGSFFNPEADYSAEQADFIRSSAGLALQQTALQSAHQFSADEGINGGTMNMHSLTLNDTMDTAQISFILRPEGDDSLSYITMELNYAADAWSVSFIGLEK